MPSFLFYSGLDRDDGDAAAPARGGMSIVLMPLPHHQEAGEHVREEKKHYCGSRTVCVCLWIFAGETGLRRKSHVHGACVCDCMCVE
jgi:hypothetical protein